MSDELTVFIGPTAYGRDLVRLFGPGVAFRPPARRGDIERLISQPHTPRRIAIVDGTFHSYPAVGHAEIRQALRQGFAVWGLSSMGAIRAAEMQDLGMRGFGRVFRRYATDEHYTDDEVALTHMTEAPYMPLSEPLIHIRTFLDSLIAEQAISDEVAEDTTAALRRRWYGERTLAELHRLLAESTGRSFDVLRKDAKGFDRHRLKSLDMIDFATRAPWRHEPPSSPTADIHRATTVATP